MAHTKSSSSLRTIKRSLNVVLNQLSVVTKIRLVCDIPHLEDTLATIVGESFAQFDESNQEGRKRETFSHVSQCLLFMRSRLLSVWSCFHLSVIAQYLGWCLAREAMFASLGQRLWIGVQGAAEDVAGDLF